MKYMNFKITEKFGFKNQEIKESEFLVFQVS